MSKVEDGRFKDLPMQRLVLPPNEALPRELEIAIHPNRSGVIILNYPGTNGSIDGYNGKHRTLAYYMQAESLGAVVRCSNKPDEGEPWEVALRRMLEYALEHAEEISGKKDPSVYIIGTSAGAGAAAAIAHEYPLVRKLLLMAPAGDAGLTRVTKGLSRFNGEITIVIGQDDKRVGASAGQWFHSMATAALRRELFTIPNCDHHFSGEANGRIMSQAPFYAFARGEKPKFPQPGGGIKLY